jgi:hypothetical protein
LVVITSPATGEDWPLGGENIGVEIPGATYRETQTIVADILSRMFESFSPEVPNQVV